MGLTVHWILCALLGLAFVALAAYRKTLVVDEDHPLHLGGGPVVSNPAADRKLAMVDRYRSILLAVLVVYGIILIGATLYLEWNRISS